MGAAVTRRAARRPLRGRAAKRLTVLMTVHDHFRHRSMELEVLARLRKAKLAGATVFEADQGFGTSGVLHRGHYLSDDRPLAVVVVDAPEKIDALVDALAAVLHDVVALVEDVEIVEL